MKYPEKYDAFTLKNNTTGDSHTKENYPKIGLNRDSNPGPLAPKARIIPLDH